ncbi:MAG: DUF1499 domain-containing protein [Chloroflexaceae bacterium]|jgi:uncharacterized protein (DUF1499 family)|nr:DUF1499 domain-containing protein [Chloroflexaceae bacterium]
MSRLVKIALWAGGILVGLVVAGVAALAVMARMVEPPTQLGVRDGRLADCPGTPNCVATQASDQRFALPPLPYSGDTAAARASLLEVLGNQPRMTLLSEEPTYVHVLFRSPTMGYPDDVEFFFDEANRLIHFRAAARMGQSDMGVNRARMEQISSELAAVLR